MENLEAKNVGLAIGLVESGLVLVQWWPRSHEGCPRGFVVSHRNHGIYVIRSCLIGNCCLLSIDVNFFNSAPTLL